MLILAGATFAWTTIALRFAALFERFGTVWTIGDARTTSPLVTPCFYGGIAFLLAFGWAVRLLYAYDERSQRYLSYLLLFGTLFAAVVLSVELCQYYRIFGGPLLACAPGVFPLAGPCAVGGAVYLVSFVLARILLRVTR